MRYALTLLFFLTILLLAANVSICSGQTVFVSQHHWVYEFFDRMESRGILSHALLSTKPLTRRDIASLLLRVSRAQEKGIVLNSVEKDQLTFLVFEFSEELEHYDTDLPYQSRFYKLKSSPFGQKYIPDVIYHNGRDFLSYTNDNLSVYWDPIFLRTGLWGIADTVSHHERVYENCNGFVLWGTVGKSIGFFCDIRDTREWGTREYPDRFDITRRRLGFVNGYGDHIYHDETVAYVTYESSHFIFQFGKDSNFWGPGYRGALALSDYATSFDLIKFQARFNRFRFTSILGFLRNYPPLVINGTQRDKSLAAHRLEMSPAKWLEIGLHETVIYSGRKLEPAYLNPVMFYRSADHYLGDRDNVGMGCDAKLMVLPKTKLYGELFIDDITTTKLGTGYYGNKYAFLVGAHHVNLLGLDNLDLHLEYTRIRPFVYSHQDSLNTYTNFTTVLGHFAGPNADDVYAGLQYAISWRLKCKVFWEQWRHGANSSNTNYGGDVNLSYLVIRDPENISFLEGVGEQNTTIGLAINYELIRNGMVQLQYQLSRGHAQDRQKLDLVSGDRSEFYLRLSLNY